MFRVVIKLGVVTLFFLFSVGLSSAAGGGVVHLSPAEEAWVLGHPVIRLGVDPEFAPFEFVEDGRYLGIASDYVALLKKRTGLNLHIVPSLTWKEVTGAVKVGDIDLLPCVGLTKERQAYLKYSEPYLHFLRVIITRSEMPFLSGLDDISSMRVAVQANSSHSGYLKDHSHISPLAYPTLEKALKAVSSGEADAFVGNIASATYWIRRFNLTNLKVAAPVSQQEQLLYFAGRSDWPELTNIINKGLASISREEANAIRQKWIPIDYKLGVDPRHVMGYLLSLGGFFLAIVLGFLVWNFGLKKEIAKRKQAEAALEEFQHMLEDRVIERTLELAAANESLKEEVVERQEAEKLVTMAENQWRHTFNSISDLIFVLDLDHTIIKANKAAMDKIDPNLEGKRCYEVFHGLDSPIQGCPHVELIEKKETITKEVYDPAQDIYLLVTDSPIFEKGILKGSVHIAKDITAKKKVENELEEYRQHLEEKVEERTSELAEANVRLQELDRLKSMFIASMSHELRTPLNSIIGFTGIILQGMTGELNEKQHDQLSRVYGAAKHLLNLITDVIDISKIEAGRVEVFPEEFLFAEIVDEAVAAVQPQLTKMALDLDIDIPPDLVLYSDRKRLLQCLINYLSNAVKFTEKGRVTLGAKVLENELEILVSDTGIGIASDDIPRLFGSFERLDSHLRIKVGGTGLGLYLTKKLATELLQGSVSVQSVPGEGSVFGLRIPCTLREEIESERSIS